MNKSISQWHNRHWTSQYPKDITDIEQVNIPKDITDIEQVNIPNEMTDIEQVNIL